MYQHFNIYNKIYIFPWQPMTTLITLLYVYITHLKHYTIHNHSQHPSIFLSFKRNPVLAKLLQQWQYLSITKMRKMQWNPKFKDQYYKGVSVKVLWKMFTIHVLARILQVCATGFSNWRNIHNYTYILSKKEKINV